MAPEVGRGGQPRPAADIYALGAILWTLLTGIPPKGSASITAQFSDDEALAGVCKKCLANDPNVRYQSAANVVHALTRIVSQQSDPTVKNSLRQLISGSGICH